MDINSIINTITVIAAGAGIIVTQILKSKLIPIPFQNAPVPTALLVSAVATYFALVAQNYHFAWNTWEQAVGTLIVVFGTMAVVYTNSIHNWEGVRRLEAPKV